MSTLKQLLVPSLILIVAAIFSAALIFTHALSIPASANQITFDATKDARVLKVSLPGIKCVGCAGSIQGYVKSMPGVEYSSVSVESKTGVFVYDSQKITKEIILKNTIFDIYAPIVVSDESYDPKTFRANG
jgi:copper chaperone CopZ